MIKVGLVGATGYTGAELLRLLISHPRANVVTVTSRSNQGMSVDDFYSGFNGSTDLKFSDASLDNLAACDVVFFATPHGVAQSMVPKIIDAGVRVIDLSADFRIRDVATWEKWYELNHRAPEYLPRAVYGLPEFNREKLFSAYLVACPGCYPTSVALGLLPLLEVGCVDLSDIIANVASGVSGAGRKARIENLFSEISDSYKAYGVSGHRHQPEIEQTLSEIASDKVNVIFVPHLAPLNRGIHSTIYANIVDADVDIQKLFEKRYANEPFVKVLKSGVCPSTRSVRGTNFCQIAIHRPKNGKKIVILVVEDNLTKGAAGQALQCMNIMFSLPENCGLKGSAMVP